MSKFDLLLAALRRCVVSSASTAWQFSWDQASDTQLKPSNSPKECLGLGSGDTKPSCSRW